MTRRKKRALDNLTRAWSSAHRSRPVPMLGDDWAGRLMGRIRREAVSRSLWAQAGIDRFVWRTAAAAAAVALIFAGSALLYTTEQHKAEVVSLLSEEFDAGPPLAD